MEMAMKCVSKRGRPKGSLGVRLKLAAHHEIIIERLGQMSCNAIARDLFVEPKTLRRYLNRYVPEWREYYQQGEI